MSQFIKDVDWLDWHPNPVKPDFLVPEGAVDAHCHIFGPGDQFPFAPQRKYTPCDASAAQLWALRDYLGFSRSVIVQATCHGTDNSAMVHALQHLGNTARGVATVKTNVSNQELEALHAAGVRGVRFNFVKRLVNVLPFDDLMSIVEKIHKYNWHTVIYFEAQDLTAYRDFFTALPTIVVVDHMGRPDVTQDARGKAFEPFIQLLEENSNFWCKVSGAERLSVIGPPIYDDFVPFARKVVKRFPDRVLWGTDWPHPNMKSHMPDDGELVNLIPRIAPTPSLQHQLLVDNPSRLYWDESPSH